MAALKYSPQRTGRPNARHVTKRSHTQYSRMVKSSLHDGRPARIGQSSARRTSASNMGNSRDLKLVKKHEIRHPRNRHGQSRSELGGRSEEFIRRELLSRKFRARNARRDLPLGTLSKKGSDKDKSKTAEPRVTNNPRSRPLQLNEKKNVSANTNANVGGIINNNDSGSTKTNPRNKKIGIMTAGQRNELIADNRNKVARHQRHESRLANEPTGSKCSEELAKQHGRSDSFSRTSGQFSKDYTRPRLSGRKLLPSTENTNPASTKRSSSPNVSTTSDTHTNKNFIDQHRNTPAGADARPKVCQQTSDVEKTVKLSECSEVTDTGTSGKSQQVIGLISTENGDDALLEDGECSVDGGLIPAKSTEKTRLSIGKLPSGIIIDGANDDNYDSVKSTPEISGHVHKSSPKKRNRWSRDADSDSRDESASLTPRKKKTKDRWASASESSEEETEDQNSKTESPKLAPESQQQLQQINERQQLHHTLISGCRSITKFQRLNRIAEGTYGIVFRAMCLDTKRTFALKKVKNKSDSSGFPITALREINVLLSLQHENIISVKEMVVDDDHEEVYMVMDYMKHDIKMLMEKRMTKPFEQPEVKCLMKQLLSAMEYMHSHWYLHRDLKTSNLLYGDDGRLRVCDFGLARRYGQPLEEYTRRVVTQWYRPPELLMGERKYSTAVDMWGVGCIFAELLRKKPLFPTNKESAVVQLQKIFSLHGTPTEERWSDWKTLPNATTVKWRTSKSKLRELLPKRTIYVRPYLSPAGMALLEGLLRYDPQKRISARSAVAHEYFSEAPLAKEERDMPTFPATTDGKRYKKPNESMFPAAMS